MHAGCKAMGGVGMPQGREGHAGCGHAGTVCGWAEGPLDTAPTPGRSRQRTWGVIAPGGGQEPGLMTMGLPGGTQQREGLGGQGDVPVCGARAPRDMDLKTLAIDGRDLQEEGCMPPESHAGDGGAGDLVVQGSGGREEPPDLLHTADGGEPVGGWRAQEREGGPVALEDVRREEADTTGAETHGRGGEAVDVLPVQEGVLQCLCSDAVGGCVGALSQQADFPDRSFLSPFALATALESRNHVLTQWAHEISPFVR